MKLKMKVQPHCDVSTGKIYGCQKGSWSWWHEKGHIEFNKLPSTSNLKMYQIFAFSFWMITITLTFVNKYMFWIALLLLTFYIYVDIYEEHWANQYAISKFNS